MLSFLRHRSSPPFCLARGFSNVIRIGITFFGQLCHITLIAGINFFYTRYLLMPTRSNCLYFLTMYFGAKTCLFMTLIQCVCACVLDYHIVLWFAVCIDDRNDRSICTDSPSCPYIRPVELRTGCKSYPKSNLAPWAKMLGQTLGASFLNQNKFISMYVF